MDWVQSDTRAILLGLQIVMGTLCFAFGCIGAVNADEKVQAGLRHAKAYGVLSILGIFLGLLLYASGGYLMLLGQLGAQNIPGTNLANVLQTANN